MGDSYNGDINDGDNNVGDIDNTDQRISKNLRVLFDKLP